MNEWSLKSVELIEDNTLFFIFTKTWFQEDIVELIDIIFSRVPDQVIVEHIKGADREDVRFNWKNTHYILHFDYYSQSCWVDIESSAASSSMSALHALYAS